MALHFGGAPSSWRRPAARHRRRLSPYRPSPLAEPHLDRVGHRHYPRLPNLHLHHAPLFQSPQAVTLQQSGISIVLYEDRRAILSPALQQSNISPILLQALSLASSYAPHPLLARARGKSFIAVSVQSTIDTIQVCAALFPPCDPRPVGLFPTTLSSRTDGNLLVY